MSHPTTRIYVWDYGIRLFHWALLCTVCAALATGYWGPKSILTWHVTAGASAGLLLVWRFIWGFSGSTYARFSSFIFSADTVFQQIRSFLSKSHQRYIGHNPLGSAMIFVLILTLSCSILTGLITLAGVYKQGPFAFATHYELGMQTRAFHAALSITLLILIGLHVLGVIHESIQNQNQLIKAMVTGFKQFKPSAIFVDADRKVYKPRPIVAVGLALISGLSLIAFGTRLSTLPGLGTPKQASDSLYSQECGACHFAYPPSLGRSQTWAAIMEQLNNHFGEDASLPQATHAHITRYLIENASEHYDTNIAHRFAVMNPSEPLRFTETSFWRWQHKAIPETVFKMKSVGTKGACRACHQDADTGRFDPQSISIPKEAFP